MISFPSDVFQCAFSFRPENTTWTLPSLLVTQIPVSSLTGIGEYILNTVLGSIFEESYRFAFCIHKHSSCRARWHGLTRWVYSSSLPPRMPILWSDIYWYIAPGHSVPKPGLPRNSPPRHVALVSMLWCSGGNLQVDSTWFFFPPYGKSFSADLKPGQLQVRPGASVTSHPQESWGERGTSINQAHQPVFLFSSESTWPSLLVGIDLILWQAGFGMVTPSAPHSMATSESSFTLKPNSTSLHSSQPHLPHLWTVLVFLEPHLTQMTCMLLVLLDFLNLFSI